MKTLKTKTVLLLLVLTACGNNTKPAQPLIDGYSGGYPNHTHYTQTQTTEPKHAIRSITHEVFNQTINNPRPLEINGLISAGVVPHHVTAATLISGFFAGVSAFADHYDLVIILAPNHEGDLADVVLSYRDWDVGSGVFTDRDFVNGLMAAHHINTAISHNHMETDHSASILIPYVYHYLPNTKAAPMLLGRSLSLSGTFNLFNWLWDWVSDSGQSVLLIASIDFSHFLTSAEAAEKDLITTNAILNRDYQFIHSLNDHYLDSPASMIIFLKYLDALGLSPQIIHNTDAAEFMGPGLCETTSYKIIIGTAGF
jgi:hypothetical protein